jgi:Flp pilus assembly protein TadD
MLAINPNDGNLRSSLAVYLAKTGDRIESRREISRALDLAPQNVNVIFKSAQVYEISGDRSSARRYLSEALAKGYSIDEARYLPEFSGLRNEPDIKQLIARLSAKAATNY